MKVTAFEDPLWRLEFPRLADWNLGPSFDPVCAFDGNRFVLASRPDLLPVPAGAAGESHVAADLELEPALAAYRSITAHVPSAPRVDLPPSFLETVDGIHLEGRYTGEGLSLRIRLRLRR